MKARIPPPAIDHARLCCCRAQVLTQAGPYVKEEVVRALIVVITNAPDLHGYCARAMYRALQRDAAIADPALITAATWVIGQSLATGDSRRHTGDWIVTPSVCLYTVAMMTVRTAGIQDDRAPELVQHPCSGKSTLH